MKKTTISFDHFTENEISNTQKKSIKGGGGSNGTKTGGLPMEGEPVGTNNNGDGVPNDNDNIIIITDPM
ncbi:hypothetical protein [Flavobacterium pedocola]